jgi:hypothetical protein
MARLLRREDGITTPPYTDQNPLPTLSEPIHLLPEPKTTPELAMEREEVNKCCYNGGQVSSEALIRMAITGRIAFLDLYSYHETALTPRAAKYSEEHPNDKVVYVGLEFRGIGAKRGNEFMINYDALRFMKRISDSSVGYVNIDQAFIRSPPSGIMDEAARILEPKGILSLYILQQEKNDVEKKLRSLGFSEVTFPPHNPHDDLDYLTRRKDVPPRIAVRVVATK